MNQHDLTINKSNSLIAASYKLTLNEQRLVLACIAQIDSRKPIPNLIHIYAKDFGEIYKLDQKDVYRALAEATTNLYHRDIKTYDGRNRERFRWVDYVKYHDQEGYVSLSFTRWVAPYLSLLHKQFTSYRIKQVAMLKSIYSIRLFELLIQFKSTGKLIIEVSKFKDFLELGDQYNRFYDLKRWVIEPAIKELKNKSNLIIEWEVNKKGQKIESLLFTFKENEQISLELNSAS